MTLFSLENNRCGILWLYHLKRRCTSTSTLVCAALHKHRLRHQMVCVELRMDASTAKGRTGDHQPHRTAYEHVGTVPALQPAESIAQLQSGVGWSRLLRRRAELRLSGRHRLHRIPRPRPD